MLRKKALLGELDPAVILDYFPFFHGLSYAFYALGEVKPIDFVADERHSQAYAGNSGIAQAQEWVDH